MAKLFTGSGDNGTTGLLGNERVSKDDPRLEAIGSLDELSAFLGQAKSLAGDPPTIKVIDEVQRDLYTIMTELAVTAENTAKFKPFQKDRVDFLEKWISAWGEEIEIPHDFILPGETRISAAFSICRTQTRRAERRLVGLHEDKSRNDQVLRYMNRLSSLLFVLEIKYSKQGKKQKLKLARI
jgi:cob(I)alamin adenosyltransferase